MTKKRSTWVALLLSLAEPGLGFVYNTKITAGFVIIVLSNLISILLLALSDVFKSAWVLFASFASIILFYIGTLIYVALDARRLGVVPLTPYNRGYIYILIVVVTYSLNFLTPESSVKSYSMPTGSMEPSILPGDFVMVDMEEPNRRNFQRGDLIVFKEPRDTTSHFLKRLVAFARDTVEIIDGRVFVNRQEFMPYLPIKRTNWERLSADFVEDQIYPPGAGNSDHYGPIVVPQDSIFFLGDHRDNSLDSRYIGFAGRDAILGIPLYIYWSRDLSRIGKNLVQRHNEPA